MSKKQQEPDIIKQLRKSQFKVIDVQKLTIRDLRKECIARGAKFEDIINHDIYFLNSYIEDNMFKQPDYSLVDDFDVWMENELRLHGNDDLIHPKLRLGYIGGNDDDDEKKPPKEKIIKEKKPPREKTSNGLFKGTKKAYVYELQARGKTIEQTIVKVKRKFPDAIDKSIKIWYNKAKKLNNGKGSKKKG